MPYTIKAPLCEEPYLERSDILKFLKENNVKPPRIYAEGFFHNNCGGFCVKQGLAAHKNLLEKRPDVYAYHEEQERVTKEIIGKGHGFIKKQIKGKHYYLSMEEYRKYLTSGDDLFLNEEEKLDFGGCGCFNDFDDSELNGENCEGFSSD